VNVSLQIAVAGVYCVLLTLVFVRARRHYLSMPELKRLPREGPLPDCMVVIPARNEEGAIARAVRSLPPDTVIVVDDFSTDNTAKEARNAGAGVLMAPALPRGALGKPNACMAGAQVLTSRWILFADADTWYEPGFLDSAVSAAEAGGLDLLSIQLAFQPKGLLERMLTPYAEALFFSAVHPKSDPVAAFNGQCLLVRRLPYEFFGGHTAVLTSPVDDVRFARLAARHRMKKAVLRTSRLGYVRPYSGWSGFRDGIRRNAFRTTLLDGKIGATIIGAALLAALWLPVLAWLAVSQEWVAASVVFLVWLLLMVPWYRGWVWLAPLGVYLMLHIVVTAAVTVTMDRKIQWKGRSIDNG
jgi:glycosyltransferase involved in cell wall biosynthesis